MSQCMCVLAKSLQSCLTVWNPMECSPSASSFHGFSRQEYRSGLPCPPPGHLLDPGIEPESPVASALGADSLLLSYQSSLRWIRSFISFIFLFLNFYLSFQYSLCLHTSLPLPVPLLKYTSPISLLGQLFMFFPIQLKTGISFKALFEPSAIPHKEFVPPFSVSVTFYLYFKW